MCLAQEHNTVTPMGLEPSTSPFEIRHSTTTPLHSHEIIIKFDNLVLEQIMLVSNTIKTLLFVKHGRLPLSKNSHTQSQTWQITFI